MTSSSKMGYDIKILDKNNNNILYTDWLSYNLSCHKSYFDINNKPVSEAYYIIENSIINLRREYPDIKYIEYASRYSKNINDLYSILYDLYKKLNELRFESRCIIYVN